MFSSQPSIVVSQPQTLDSDPISTYIKTIKDTRKPNLFTTLKVSGNGITEDVIITALDIVLIVESILDENLKREQILEDNLKALDANNTNLNEAGSQNNPYSLRTPMEWLLAAKNYELTKDREEFKYFSIGKQIIRISTLDRYCSSEDNRPDDFYEFMHNSINQYVINLSNPTALDALRKIFLKFNAKSNSEKMNFVFTFVLHLMQNINAKYITSGYYLHLISEQDLTNHTSLQTPCLVYRGKDTPFQLILTDEHNDTIKVNFEDEPDKTIVEAFHNLILVPCQEKRTRIFLSSFSEIISYINSKGGRQQFVSGEEWHRPAYKGKLAPDQHAAQSYGHEQMPPLNAENIATASSAWDLEIDSSSLDDISASVKSLWRVIGSVAFSSENKEKDTMEMEELNTVFLQPVIDSLKNNTTDRTPKAILKSISNEMQKQASTENGEKENFNFDIDSIFKTVANQMEGTILDESEAEKIKVLSNVFTVLEIRSILENTVKKPSKHLPVTVASLFFSEPSRSLRTEGPGCPAVFPAGLALLDLIQAQQPCPDCNEIYSPLNLLKTPVQRTEFVDVYAKMYSKEDEKKLKNELEQKHKNDLEKIKDQRKKDKKRGEIFSEIPKVIPGNVLYNVAGYHPMVQGGSRDEVEHKEHHEDLTLVDQKSASILLQWLSLRLKENGFSVTLEKDFFVDSWLKKDRSKEKSLIENHIQKRLNDFSYLLSENTTDLSNSRSQENNTSIFDNLDFSSFFQLLNPKDSISKLISTTTRDPQKNIDNSPTMDFKCYNLLLQKSLGARDKSLLFLEKISRANAVEKERAQKQLEHDKKLGIIVYDPHQKNKYITK